MKDQHITRISLNDSRLQAPLLSYELLELLESERQEGRKTALLYNRRGSGRAWICRDCGYFPLCPHCDIALAYHTSPRTNLLCHQCNFVDHVPILCPSCHGHGFEAIGLGIQRLETDLTRLVPESRILRIDSDTHEKKEKLFRSLRQYDIILGTYSIAWILSVLDHIVFVLFESDFTIPDYRMEEELFHIIHYAKKLGKNITIQTCVPDHPLLSLILEGNYNDFLHAMSRERAKFSYPPYSEFVTIRVYDRSQDRVRDMMTRLVNKIEIIKDENIFLAFDRDIWEKSGGRWSQKILLRAKSLSEILHSLRWEIVRNRGVALEWN